MTEKEKSNRRRVTTNTPALWSVGYNEEEYTSVTAKTVEETCKLIEADRARERNR